MPDTTTIMASPMLPTVFKYLRPSAISRRVSSKAKMIVKNCSARRKPNSTIGQRALSQFSSWQVPAISCCKMRPLYSICKHMHTVFATIRPPRAKSNFGDRTICFHLGTIIVSTLALLCSSSSCSSSCIRSSTVLARFDLDPDPGSCVWSFRKESFTWSSVGISVLLVMLLVSGAMKVPLPLPSCGTKTEVAASAAASATASAATSRTASTMLPKSSLPLSAKPSPPASSATLET
mmetsp:Transcript_23163/g.57639  ORF Transcript_23163/g.57639 Transcript_23163/m.57639 type:complete len:235 (+) Transcript_23163:1295-1999(+)